MATAQVFYDGECGLCHFTVRFLIARDKRGEQFRFAPLGGLTFQQTLTEDQRTALPDSLVVHTPDGEVLVRSRAVRYALKRLGCPWRLLSLLLWLVPVPLLDATYAGIAHIRHRLFDKPTGACPVVPDKVRSRLDP